MMATIAIGIVSFSILVLVGVLIYRSARTFDANPNHTYVVQSKGEIAGALRQPATLWDPGLSVLRDKDAPEINFPAMRAKTGEIYTRPLVDRRTGRISLMVNTCTPEPFYSTTLDGHQLKITANIVFRLDIERIHITSQLDNFGATLANRIENLFDNEITKCRDEEVRSKQEEIEASITRTLRDIEEHPDDEMMGGMPLGIKVYEASFSFIDRAAEEEATNSSGQTADGRSLGPVWLDVTRIDRLADALADRDPAVRDAVIRMIELQTRQNIVETLCKTGGMVAFTAKELGLNDLVSDEGVSGKQGTILRSAAPTAVEPEFDEPESDQASPAATEKDYYGRPIKRSS